jgi:predicted transcriptional regulator
MVRNAMAFYVPIADWCIQAGLIKGSPAMSGVKYEITEAGRAYIEKYHDFDPE